ncbi:MAG: hypothetical protein GC162_00155 [Planctomycetes bacterium]|nr:hypothetical protein [Planctomycetota bacterium]
MFDPWPRLLDEPALIAAAGSCDDLTAPAAVASLRKSWPAELVQAAIALTIARHKAAAKFDHADRLVADPVGVEQATSIDVARHKARRFTEAGIDTVVDLCCGIGGDALAFAESMRVLLIDRDPARAWMARHNTRQPAAVADVTTLKLDGLAFHIDPDRRLGGRRAWRYEDCAPGPGFLNTLSGDGAMKLSPGADLAQLPRGEIEIISRAGTLVQTVVWTGRLARHDRTATLILPPLPPREGLGEGESHPSQSCSESELKHRDSLERISFTPTQPSPSKGEGFRSITLHGSPGEPPLTEPARFLYTVDPAIERAALMPVLCGQLNLAAIHPALGLLTSDRVLESPWLRRFELIETQPWRPRKIKAWLVAHDAGVVEVKTRDKAVDPDVVARQMRGDGPEVFTLFVLRYDRKVVCLITRRQ